MVDYRKLLDAFVGAVSRPDQHQDRPETTGTQTGATQPGMRQQLEQNVRQLSGQSPEQLLQKAKDLAAQHPGLTQAALVGLAGLLFKGRKKGKMTGNLVKLGGLAVIGGLAYRAYQSRQGSKDIAGKQGIIPAISGGDAASETLSPPEQSRFHPVSQTEDDALLFLKTTVAAASADGHIDETERARIVKGLTEAGLDPDSSRWLDTEMASPADVEELAGNVNDPEKAAQVYAAARIAIDPDTIQEREFLNQLAGALDLDQATRKQIDDTADSLS
jgi:uncharacterized membrane protein YebE (DUF533 family)